MRRGWTNRVASFQAALVLLSKHGFRQRLFLGPRRRRLLRRSNALPQHLREQFGHAFPGPPEGQRILLAFKRSVPHTPEPKLTAVAVTREGPKAILKHTSRSEVRRPSIHNSLPSILTNGHI